MARVKNPSSRLMNLFGGMRPHLLHLTTEVQIKPGLKIHQVV